MRQLILPVFILLAPLIISCKKTKVEVTPSIIGSWELRKGYGGFIMPDTTYFQPGNGNILIFTATTYQSYSQGQLIETAAYTIIKDTSAGGVLDRLILNNRTDLDKIFVEIDNDRLKWMVNIPDHGIIEYQRIR